jgi:ESCRT-II complex subunit VPS22
MGTSLTAQTTADLISQLSQFQSLLSTFASRHASEIRQNAAFRSEFARMCSAIGVDPLVGLGASDKWGRGWGMLGVGEFWVRVGTRVVGVCRRTRGGNGGFISIREVVRILFEEDSRTGRDVVEISEYWARFFGPSG